MLTPRPYQDRTDAEARKAYTAGKRRLLIVAPTGAGKSFMGARFGLGAVSKGGRVVWVAHRTELLDQAVSTLRELGLRPGVISPDHIADPSAPVQVASTQTLLSRGGLPPADVLIPDEAHHYVSPEWRSILTHYRERGTLIIGLTATPERSDGVAMGNEFDAMITSAQPSELIRDGYLVRARVIGPTRQTSKLAEHPVEAYRKLGPTRRAIVFCASVKHARDTAHEFNAVGIIAQCVDGKMSSDSRAAAIRDFRSGRLRVLTNMHVLTEGFDCPETDMVMLCRAFSSASAMIQATGRGARPAAGKSDLIVFDGRGSTHEHGLPDMDRTYSLEGKAITVTAGLDAISQCPSCGHCFEASKWIDATCPECGFVRRALRNPATIKRVPLSEIRGGDPLTARTAYLRKQVGLCRAKGWKVGRAIIVFKKVYGHWPDEAMKRAAGLS